MKTCGPAKMPILVLKETSNEIAPILQNIFQKSLNTGEIPTEWKMPTSYLSSRRVTEPNPPIIDQLAKPGLDIIWISCDSLHA